MHMTNSTESIVMSLNCALVTFEMACCFTLTGFKRKLKNELNRAKRFGNFFGGLTKR